VAPTATAHLTEASSEVPGEPMSEIVLYDNRESTNANKVRFLLAELGLDHEVREMPLRDKPDEYFEIHPFGLVPALIDGDLVITESNVALRYLAEREGRFDLRGATAAHRARIDGLLDTLSLELRPALWRAEEPVVYGVELSADERAARHTALVAAAVAYDRLLDADGPYALGAFTIADCAIAGRCCYLERLGLEHDVAPRLRRVIAAAQSRRCWAGVMGPT
jgi:glutathione S-transferase